MKNTLKALFAIATIGATSIASALTIPSSGTVKIDNTAFDGGSNPGMQGGEFKATIQETGHVFYTFCLERDVTIYTNQVYSYSISNATDGAVPDVLSQGSAYLYNLFVKGQLYPRLQDGDTGSHDQNAGFMQAALWYLEDESFAGWSASRYDTWVTNNPFLSLVATVFAGAEKDDYTGGKIAVMNTFDANGNKMQDQIVYVPDSGSTLVLLGLVVSGLAVLRRRR